MPLHEFGLIDRSRPYVTLLYVRGRTLKQVLYEPLADEHYSLTRLVQIFQQVCQAVSYAHAKGVIHRELKPANVMMGEHGEVQLLDWGLAKVTGTVGGVDVEESGTRSGTILGSPGYMAPEQARERPLDHRADVYSLGAILYEILTRERLFSGSAIDVLAATCREPPIAPRRRAPERDIPLELERTCLRALSKSPDDRQSTVAELVAEVHRWLETATERDKRRARADELVATGRERFELYLQRKRERERLRASAAEVVAGHPSWQPAEEKLDVVEVRRQEAEADSTLARFSSEVVTTLNRWRSTRSTPVAARRRRTITGRGSRTPSAAATRRTSSSTPGWWPSITTASTAASWTARAACRCRRSRRRPRRCCTDVCRTASPWG